MAPPSREMPDNYQQLDVRAALFTLNVGESCALIGIGSVGKSNLLRHMIRPPVKEFHLGENAAALILVLLDSHSMVALEGKALGCCGKTWAGFELMLSRLHRAMSALADQGFAEVEQAKLHDLGTRLLKYHHKMFSPVPAVAQSGLRHLEQSVYRVLNAYENWQIAFLFDEIESFRVLPPEFFVGLRGLRDDFKNRVMYLATGQTELDAVFAATAQSAQERRLYGNFVELFRANTYYINPLDEESARALFQLLTNVYHLGPILAPDAADDLFRSLFEITGGHAGLLRRGFRPTIRYWREGCPGKLLDALLADESTCQECQEIIDSLTEPEKQCLREILNGVHVLRDEVWHKLLEKHIVEEGPDGARFRFPILDPYIMQKPDRLNRKP